MTRCELDAALRELGMTRAALAQLTGVERRTVYRWLSDIPVPVYVETILRLWRTLHLHGIAP
jgi:transcriptional regulator with XRE-family HTH domain